MKLKYIMIIIILLSSALMASAQQPPMPTYSIGNIALTANPASISADGTSTSVITVVTVEDPDFAGGRVEAGLITLTTTLGTINGSVQLKNGTATAILKAGTTPGTAAIVAEYVSQNSSRGKVNVTFTAAAPGQTQAKSPTGNTQTGQTPTPARPGAAQTPVITTTPVQPAITAIPTQTETILPTSTPGKTEPVSTPARSTPGLGALTAISMLAAVYLICMRKKKL